MKPIPAAWATAATHARAGGPVLVALVVTPEGLPLAYEMFPGHTADKTTLRDLRALIQKRPGQAQRLWVMDRGIPTEAVLEELRQADAKVSYRVGTPQGRLTKLAAKFVEQPWQQVRPPRRGQLLPQAGEVHVPAHRGARTAKGSHSRSLYAQTDKYGATPRF